MQYVSPKTINIIHIINIFNNVNNFNNSICKEIYLGLAVWILTQKANC